MIPIYNHARDGPHVQHGRNKRSVSADAQSSGGPGSYHDDQLGDGKSKKRAWVDQHRDGARACGVEPKTAQTALETTLPNIGRDVGMRGRLNTE